MEPVGNIWKLGKYPYLMAGMGKLGKKFAWELEKPFKRFLAGQVQCPSEYAKEPFGCVVQNQGRNELEMSVDNY